MVSSSSNSVVVVVVVVVVVIVVVVVVGIVSNNDHYILYKNGPFQQELGDRNGEKSVGWKHEKYDWKW